MTKTVIYNNNKMITEEQIREVEEAGRHPILLDKDCEELSPAMVKAFRCAVVHRNRRNERLKDCN